MVVPSVARTSQSKYLPQVLARTAPAPPVTRRPRLVAPTVTITVPMRDFRARRHDSDSEDFDAAQGGPPHITGMRMMLLNLRVAALAYRSLRRSGSRGWTRISFVARRRLIGPTNRPAPSRCTVTARRRSRTRTQLRWPDPATATIAGARSAWAEP